LGVPSHWLTRRYEHVNDYFHLPKITLDQIEHFFAHYKDLELKKWVKIVGWEGAAHARKLLDEGIERAKAYLDPTKGLHKGRYVG